MSETSPVAVDSIIFGFDAFRQVYPLPGWWRAYRQGLATYEQQR